MFCAGAAFDFNSLAVDLFKWQHAHSDAWRGLVEFRGVEPLSVSDWRSIPSMPVAAYKTVWVGTAPPERCVPEFGGRTFHSSGTTGLRFSRNGLDASALRLYELSLLAGWDLFPGGDGNPRTLLALMPPPDCAPNSSLSHMAGVLIERHGGAFLSPEVDSDWIALACDAMAEASKPLAVFGTAFAWVHLFDSDPSWRTVLPEGSLVVETGGYKGRSREVAVGELYGWFRDRLGVSDAQCWSEYGMSELASQYWSRGVAGVKWAPPWMRPRVLDPVSLDELPAGETGVLCHVDLANVGGAVAIRTGDLGRIESSGGLRCLGRMPGVDLRGCSLAAEHWGSDRSSAG